LASRMTIAPRSAADRSHEVHRNDPIGVAAQALRRRACSITMIVHSLQFDGVAFRFSRKAGACRGNFVGASPARPSA
jgi:hypothetical protein